MNNSRISEENVYAFLCVFAPILATYRSPIYGVDFGTFCILLCTPILFSSVKTGIRINGMLSIVLIYTVVCTMISLLISSTYFSSVAGIITRTGRYVLILFIMIGWGINNCFNRNNYIKLLKNVSVAAACYAILQYTVHSFTGVELPNTFGPIRTESMTKIDFVDISVYRPQSFFLEPSHVAYFLTPFLCYILFSKNNTCNKNYLFIALLISVGILCTTSGQGLLILLIVWGIWTINSIRRFNIKSVILILIAFGLILNNFDISYTIERVFRTDEYNAIDARSQGYQLITKLPWEHKLFGSGYGNYIEDAYYSSFSELIFCTGYIGLALVIIMYMKCFFTGKLFQKVLVISSLVLMTGGGIYTASYLCLFLPLLLTDGWDGTSCDEYADSELDKFLT